MKKSVISRILAVVVVVSLLLSGCSNGQKLSDLTIVQAVGIDKKDNGTKISIQYLNLEKNSGSTESLSDNITSVVYGTSGSISSAVSNASKVLSQRLFFGQNKIIVFGNDYVRSNLEKGLDYLVRSVDSRPDVLVAISEKSAADIIRSNEKDVKLAAEKIYDLLKLGERTGLGAAVTVNDLLNMYSEPTSDIFLPVLSVKNESVKCTGIAVFSGEEYRVTLTPLQSFGMLFVNGRIENGTLNVSNEDLGNVGVEILSSKSDRSAYVSNGCLHFDVRIKLRIMLDEVEHGTTTALQNKEVKMIESLVSRRVKNMCLSAINECFCNNCDAFMTGKYLARDNQTQYNRLKNEWRNILPSAQVSVKVITDLEKVNDNSVRQ